MRFLLFTKMDIGRLYSEQLPEIHKNRWESSFVVPSEVRIFQNELEKREWWLLAKVDFK